MYKEEYMNLMHEMLEDTSTYSKLGGDPTDRFQRKGNEIVKEMVLCNVIDDDSAKSLKSHNAVPPELYGLRKTHKLTPTMRPVVSCVNSPTYNLSKFIQNILTQVSTTSEYNVKNSFVFAESIQGLVIPENYILVSLDVVSLFTNVPKDLVVELTKSRWSYIAAYTDMTKEMFIRVIEFIFQSSYFSFNDEIYSQNEGTAMGNPASGGFAYLVMNDLIKKSLKRLSFHIPSLKLYVDDTWMAIPKNGIDELLAVFNGYHSKLKFTIEVETDRQIPFLDVMVYHQDDGTLKTCWYKKPSSSNRISNFSSNQQFSQKIATVNNLIIRANQLSHSDFHDDNKRIIKNMLVVNNYPRGLINGIFNSCTNTHENRVNRTAEKFFRFPYIPDLSEKMNRLFRSKLSVKLACYNLKTVNSVFTKLKDKTSRLKCSCIVYKINCKDCEKCYVGQTKQYITNRLKQHEYDGRNVNMNKREKTALADHHFENGHSFDFVDFKILDVERNYLMRNISVYVGQTQQKLKDRLKGHKYSKAPIALYKHTIENQHSFDFGKTEILEKEKNRKPREFLEMIHIKQDVNFINDRTDIRNLSCIYSTIIDNTKKKRRT
ncbi:uncharacterized protein LOC123321057 [Coccinella septempunctata]|uniref:uncharacterized protein LOC123321057 n=1 Tax=Coccinella septempunctata TaxID=41139 RepID=UPI001D0756E5|nr:uncharacterized protein LOC123321057 [Coccinella septempunctata]